MAWTVIRLATIILSLPVVLARSTESPSLFGGSAARVSITPIGTQWANVGYLSPSSSTVLAGGTLPVNFDYQSQDSGATIQLVSGYG